MRMDHELLRWAVLGAASLLIAGAAGVAGLTGDAAVEPLPTPTAERHSPDDGHADASLEESECDMHANKTSHASGHHGGHEAHAADHPQTHDHHGAPCGDGYQTLTVAHGSVACAAATPVGPVSVGDPACGDRSDVEADIPTGARVVLIELAWDASETGAETLVLAAPAMIDGTGQQRVQGVSVLRVLLEASDQAGLADPATYELSIEPADGVVVDQGFRVFTSAFVNTDMPEGYTAVPPWLGP